MNKPVIALLRTLLLLSSFSAPGWLLASEPATGFHEPDQPHWQHSGLNAIDDGFFVSLLRLGTETLNLDFTVHDDNFKTTYWIGPSGSLQLGVEMTYSWASITQGDSEKLGISLRYAF